MGKAEYVAVIGVPFAVAVIGGLLAGTLFTLVLVPTVYAGLEHTLSWLRRLGGWTRAAQLAALALGAWLIQEQVDGLLWRVVDGTVLLGGGPGPDLVPADQPAAQPRRPDPPRPAPAHLGGQPGEGLRRRAAVPAPVAPGGAAAGAPARGGGGGGGGGRPPGGPALAAASCSASTSTSPTSTWRATSGRWCSRWPLSSSWPASCAPSCRRRRAAGDASSAGSGRPCSGCCPCPTCSGTRTAGTTGRSPSSWASSGTSGPWCTAAPAGSTAARSTSTVWPDASGGGRRLFYRLVAWLPLIGRRRRPFPALKQASLEIESGMFGLIGPNGAGKTTLMRVLCGILEPTRGKVRVNGIDLSARREELQALIGYLPQAFGTYENMTAYRFLDYQAMLKGRWDAGERRRAVEEAIRAVHLEDSRDRRIGGFSGGMKQRVGIAQTLLHLPRILVVDEPTAGLDPRERIRFRNLLAELARDRVVVFSTHIIEDISSSCNRLAVLGDGEVRFLGTPREMVELTRGAVWQASVPEAGFEALRRTARIVHHMRDQDRIRVRLLAAEKPLPGAAEVTPTLEDSYLWLLEGRER